MLSMSVITYTPLSASASNTHRHTPSHTSEVCISQASSTSQARTQWPVRGTAAGGCFKVMSNDLPEESEPEAGLLPA